MFFQTTREDTFPTALYFDGFLRHKNQFLHIQLIIEIAAIWCIGIPTLRQNLIMIYGEPICILVESLGGPKNNVYDLFGATGWLTICVALLNMPIQAFLAIFDMVRKSFVTHFPRTPWRF